MFKIILLFLFMVGCEATNVDFELSNDTSTEEIIEFDNCGYETGLHSCNFAFLNEKGEKIDLYDFYGKTIILDFSTMWCYYCQQVAYDIPDSLELFKDEDIVYITVLIENWAGQSPTQDDLAEWIGHFELQSPVLSASREEIIDPTMQNGFNIEAYPTFFFIDKEMVLNSYMRGYNQEMVNASIANAL